MKSGPKPHTAEQRRKAFWEKVNKTDTCWLWTGARCGRDKRYGAFSTNNTTGMAHRYSYETFVGPIHDGMHIDHVCRNTLCVNPSHLRLATNKQNHENLIARSSSGKRGVYWDKRTQRWYIQVTHNGKRHCGPTYATLEEADQAAVELRNKLFTHNIES